MQAVIFDLDGTLSNTLDTITYYSNKALSKFGFKTAPKDNYRYFVGNGATKLIERALSYSGEWSKSDFDAVFTYYNEIYNKEPLYLTELYPKVKETLSALKADNVKIGILSNKPDFAVLGVVTSLLGDGLIDICHGARDGYNLKPDSATPLEMYSLLGADLAHSAFVGDSEVDIATGINSGVHTIGAAWGFRGRDELRAAKAEFIIDSADEIPELIRRIK